MPRQFIILMLITLIVPLSCNSDDSDSVNSVGSAWLTRKVTPVSEFAPSSIETAISTLTTELNKTPQEVGVKAAFIPKQLDAFFEAAVLGANRAFTELGMLSSVVAPSPDDGEDAQELQKMLMEEQIAEGVTHFGLAPLSDVLNPPIESAVKAGGTVITFDSDQANSARQLYVGTINVEAGKTAGKTLNELVGAGTTGTVVVFGYDDTVWRDGYDRTHEARKVLEAAGHTVIIRHVNWSEHQENVDFIAENLTNADPPAVGCLGVFNNSFACGDAVVAANLQEQIKIAAFDTEPQTLQYMQQGVIHATHVQRVYYMGYLVPYLLYAIDNLGLAQTKALIADIMVDDYRIDTGLDVIPAAGIENYNSFQNQLNAL